MMSHLKYTQMKKVIILLLIMMGFSNYGKAQSPQLMSYQAIVRDASNNLVQEEQVGVKISILKDSPSGAVSYSESHTPQTNENGMFTLEIGGGAILSGSFSSIEWNSGAYWLKTEIDPNGGTNYSISATSQLLSVPYSFHADHSAYADSTGKSINEVTENGDGTLTFHFSDGSSYTTPALSFQGQQGDQGVSIINTYIQNDSLIVELSNGQELNAGYLNCPGQNISLCTVNTIGVSDITPNTAKVSFIVPDAGNELLLAQGVCYSQSPNPTVADQKHMAMGVQLNTPTTYMISSLTPNETYYARPFATNVKGTNYGQEISFTAGAPCMNPGTYTGVLDYNLGTGSMPFMTVVYSGTVPAVLTVNNDFTISFSFTDTSIPMACNNGITFTGNLTCSNPQSNTPRILFGNGTTGGCSYTYTPSVTVQNLDPYVSFFIGLMTGDELHINDGSNSYSMSGVFTFD